jgi:hypothetical protein
MFSYTTLYITALFPESIRTMFNARKSSSSYQSRCLPANIALLAVILFNCYNLLHFAVFHVRHGSRIKLTKDEL